MMHMSMTAPPKPTFVHFHEVPPKLLTPLRRRLRDVYIGATDRGWFGLTPLQTHVVICGFPRSGTTLLQLMLETATPGALTFGRERSGLSVARYTWPGRHPILISKKPNDIFCVNDIRDYYRGRKTQVRFILSLRDPRAVLTSIFVAKQGYCVPPEKWQSVYDHIQYQRQFPDVTVVEYRDVVERPDDVRQELAGFIGCDNLQSFDRFHSSVPENFDTRALNGVRPLDTSSFDKWRSAKHAPRIRQVLAELPDLPQRLIEMGYESDTAWTREYL
jgi:hypothetical protein